ncbi:hypothetical protein RhiirA4_473464 [Rhizophagus irregularis]|uniref:Uncharacterized protein n=1 Tax=Rhizophagus irregularis TaxID=588596 RepID=A0A2I1H6W7_9GLOM|nr:hypothetical protein RhiirA4_473464 [Rhizophagus irregularis]
MPGGPAKRLAKFAKDCKEERLRPFSSYKTKKDLSEVLRKYGVEDERITYILQFVPSARGTNLHHGGEATPNSHGFAQNVVQCESDYQANKRRFRKGLRLTLLVMESSPRLRNGTFSSKSRKEFHARVKSNTTLVPPRPTLENEAELRKNVKG